MAYMVSRLLRSIWLASRTSGRYSSANQLERVPISFIDEMASAPSPSVRAMTSPNPTPSLAPILRFLITVSPLFFAVAAVVWWIVRVSPEHASLRGRSPWEATEGPSTSRCGASPARRRDEWVQGVAPQWLAPLVRVGLFLW